MKVKSFDEIELEEKIAKRKCLIKQAVDRKTRAVTNSEKQYLVKEMEKHNSFIRAYEEEIEKLKRKGEKVKKFLGKQFDEMYDVEEDNEMETRKELIKKVRELIDKENQDLNEDSKYYQKKNGKLNVDGRIIIGGRRYTINKMEQILKLILTT